MDPIEVAERLGRWSSGRGRLSALLAQRLRVMIDDGELRPGEPLPTDRALAGALAVGRSTVVSAYEMLRADGRIVRRQGSGTQVAGVRDPEPPAVMPAPDSTAPIFLQHLEPRQDGIALTSAAPAGPPPALVQAHRRVLDELDTENGSDLGYYPAGHPRLRAAVADSYRRQGLPTDPEKILITNGAQQAISLIARLLITPGDRVLVEAPSYPGALEAFRAGAAELVGTGIGMPDFSRLVEAGPVALAYAVPTFHNPTGAVLGSLPGQRLARAADRAGVWLIDDRTLAELAFPGVRTPAPLACHSDRVITLASLSKIIWGGLRIGWVRGPRPLINRLSRVRAVHDIGGGVITQLAAVHLLADLDRFRAEAGERLRSSHDHLCGLLTDRLPEWSFAPAVGGQTLWVELPYGDGDSFAQQALRHGVGVLPGSGLDPSGGGTRFLRLHFQLDRDQLTEAIDRLADAWACYRPPVEPLVDRPKLAI